MRSTLLPIAMLAAALPLAAVYAQADHSAHQSRGAHAAHDSLAKAIANPLRSEANRARDQYRNPMETLAFFGVEPGHNVVELWPGGGWYTEILAPYTADAGALWLVAPSGRGAETAQAKLASDPAYGKGRVAPFTAGQPTAVPAGSADVVLTFRNVHNWMMGETPIVDAVFAEAFRVLKPGGTLGIVEHRLPENADSARERTSGYLKTSTVRTLAEKAGFQFAGASEVNANPKDTADWPDGVWTLPPTYRLKDQDRAKYQAIGESDRMTLKFVKPPR